MIWNPLRPTPEPINRQAQEQQVMLAAARAADLLFTSAPLTDPQTMLRAGKPA